jgi:hypothetical protein
MLSHLAHAHCSVACGLNTRAHISPQVVIARPFSLFLLHNHFITEFVLKKKSGDVNDEANFSFVIYITGFFFRKISVMK